MAFNQRTLTPSGSHSGGTGAGASSINLKFDEPGDRPTGSVTWPLTVGIPFPQNVNASAAKLSANSGGAPVPSAFTSAVNWQLGSKNMAWALADVQMPFGGSAAAPSMKIVRGKAPVTPGNAVTYSNTNPTDLVSTGGVTYTCSQASFALFNALSASLTSLISSSSLYWIDTDNNRYESSVSSTSTVLVNNGMKTVIRYDGVFGHSGTNIHQYQVWVAAFANLPYVRIYARLIQNVNLTLPAVPTTGVTTWQITGPPANPAVSVAHGWANGTPVQLNYATLNPINNQTTAYSDQSGTLPSVTGTALALNTNYFWKTIDQYSGALYYDSGLTSVITPTGTIPVNTTYYLQVQKPVLKEWGLQFNLASTPTSASFGVNGAATQTYDMTATTSVKGVQSDYQTFTMTPSTGSPTTVTASSGFATATFASGHGIAVSLKNLAQQTPKALYVDQTKISVMLWSGSNMSMREEDNIPAGSLIATGTYAGFASYPKEWLVDTGEANPFGIAKTHEVWLWPVDTDANNKLKNDLVQRPPAVCADPIYACGCDYVQNVRAAALTASQYSAVDTAITNLLLYWTTQRSGSAGDFKEWNFGDLRGVFGTDVNHRTYLNGGYDFLRSYWVQYMRTGNRQLLWESHNVTRHVMDVDTCHLSQTFGSGGNGSTNLRIAGRNMVYSTLHWNWVSPYPDWFVEHPAHLLYCYLMTGYEPAVYDLNVKAAAALGFTPGSTTGNTGTDRNQYGEIDPKLTYYRLTGTAGFLSNAASWALLATNSQAISPEQSNGGDRLFANEHPSGFYNGLLDLGSLNNEPSAWSALQQLVNDFSGGGATLFTAPDWGCTLPPGRGGRAPQSLTHFVGARKVTGDVGYLAYPLDKLAKQARTVQPSGNYQGFDFLAGDLQADWMSSAMMVLGEAQRAGWPITTWAGNEPFFGSVPLPSLSLPWGSQVVLWVNKTAGVQVNIKLLVQDTEFTNLGLQAQGRIQTVTLNTDGTSTTTVLTSDTSSATTFSGTTATAVAPIITLGQPVRFTTTNTLPTGITTGTTYYAGSPTNTFDASSPPILLRAYPRTLAVLSATIVN